MKDGELTYDDFLRRLDIQDVLIDAGYCQNRRDGLRYPSYVRIGSDGRRIRGDKFIVTQQGRCCFQPPHQKVYNIISFIKEHPQLFAEYSAGMAPDRLVNLVCNRLLNHPIENREARIIRPARDIRPFDIGNYDLHRFDPQDRATQKKFYPYFKSRGIDLYTQYAFHRNFCLATKKRDDGLRYTNLAFPMTLPKDPEKTVGFEERGRARADGSSGYKGKAEGSNSSEGAVDRQPGQGCRSRRRNMSTGSRAPTTRWPTTSFIRRRTRSCARRSSYRRAATRPPRRCGACWPLPVRPNSISVSTPTWPAWTLPGT